MYVVQCMFECGEFVESRGGKPQLRWCGVNNCAEKKFREITPSQFLWITEKRPRREQEDS